MSTPTDTSRRSRGPGWRGVRARTTVAATAVVAIVFAVGGVLLTLALRASLMDAAETTAENRAEEIADAWDRGEQGEQSGDRSDDEDDDEDEFAWQVHDGGTMIASSGPGGAGLPRSGDTTRIDGERYVLARETTDDGPRVVVAASLDDADESVAALVPLLAVSLPLAVLLVAATTWVAAGRALRPVEAIRARTAGIGAGALDQRVPVPRTHDEVARLAVTMNAMLDRLETSSRRQQQFVSDTSHELRSPLASLRQTAEVARTHPDAIPAHEVTEIVLDETARMQHLVEQMLVLTRTEEGAASRPRAELDVDDLLLTEASRLRRERPDLGVDTAGVHPLRVVGDAAALAQVVRNLVDNAARHARSTVVLAGAAAGDQVIFEVADDGRGIAVEDRERVFDRFVRLDEARSADSGGSGLGLAIVAEVARAHGGDAWVESTSDGGARFRVRLPAHLNDPSDAFSEGSASSSHSGITRRAHRPRTTADDEGAPS